MSEPMCPHYRGLPQGCCPKCVAILKNSAHAEKKRKGEVFLQTLLDEAIKRGQA